MFSPSPAMRPVARRLLPTSDILFQRPLIPHHCSLTPVLPPLRQNRRGPDSLAALPYGRRTYAAYGRPAGRLSPAQQAAYRSDPDGPPMDEYIPSQWVQLVNSDKKLDPPINLHGALQTFDRSVFALVQMAAGSEVRPPVCKVQTWEEIEERRKERAKPAKEPSKQLELNWGINDHDLEHRLRKLQQFLEKGKQVEILLLPKKKKKAATKEQAMHVLRQVKSAIIQMGGIEWKSMSGSLLGVLTLFVKKDTKKSKAMSQKTESSEGQPTTAEAESTEGQKSEES